MPRRAFAVLFSLALIAGQARAEAPLRWDVTGHVVVPVLVDGKGPFDFILDTGADESAVFAWFAKALNLPKGRAGELSGATGSAPMTASKVQALTVDGRTLRDIEADTVPDRADGVKIAGIAGVDLMAGRLTVIDFGCKTVALLPLQGAPADIAGPGAVAIKAGSIRDGKQLTLPVTANGAPGVAVLDSGAKATAINLKFALASGVDPLSRAFRDADPTRGATMAPVASRVGPIGTVRFAGLARLGVTARVLDLPYLQSAGLANVPVMNMGLDLLRDTRLTLDYSARRFWLAPSRCPAAATPPAL